MRKAAHVRWLMSYGSNTYTYNTDGIRTSKTVNGVEHIYHLSGTQILDEEWTEGNTRHLMVYVYDASGQPIGISHYTYNGTIVSENDYLLVSNIQGDIIGIYDSNGTRVVTYVYDAWGVYSLPPGPALIPSAYITRSVTEVITTITRQASTTSTADITCV